MKLKLNVLKIIGVFSFLLLSVCSLSYASPAGWSVGIFEGAPLLTTDEGIEWLSPTATKGISFNSITTILSDENSSLYGFRLADNTQIASLFNAYGVAIATSSANFVPVQTFLNDFGFTGQATGYRFVQGISKTIGTEADRVFTPLVFESFSTSKGYAALTESQNTLDFSHIEIGSWLLRDATPVPVPSSIWLFIPGFLGLIGFKKRIC